MFASLWRFGVLCITLLLFAAGLATAESDPFGELDLVWVDSVQIGAGRSAAVSVNIRNDEPLSSVSIPLTYDADWLTLDSISFVGSRVEHIQNLIVNPDKPADMSGHVLVAIIKVLEAPISPGEGLIFTANFTVSPDAEVGRVLDIDSLFYAPGGEMLLVENSTSGLIYPAFNKGRIVVREANRQPSFVGLSDQYVLEGQTLAMDIKISDPDNDPIKLAVTSKPSGAVFTDNGDGTGQLSWVPAYVGPYSADGSPFTVSFWAGDGELAVEKTIRLDVLNMNRQPVIGDMPAEYVVDAGEAVQFEVFASDPDFEAITWQVLNKQSAATVAGENPVRYAWQSAVTDTGSTTLTFIASDIQGAADTCNIAVRVRPATLYALTIDTASTDPGTNIDVDILLENMLPVTGYNVLFSYDPTALTITGVTNDGTRSADFAGFDVSYDEDGVTGNVRVLGTASATALAAGTGAVITLSFRATGDISFADMSIPLTFKFLDIATGNDNTLLDTAGVRIDQDDIFYTNGSVKINSIGEIKVGDINLNNIAYEIGDIILLTNYFIRPTEYPLNLLQLANSDVNNDHIVGSLADLVTLINIVVSGGPYAGKMLDADDLTAEVTLRRESGSATVAYTAGCAMGAALASFDVPEGFDLSTITLAQADMQMVTYQDETTVNLLVYSMSGVVLPEGSHDLFYIDSDDDLMVSSVEMGATSGQAMAVTLSSVDVLPTGFALEQNYPNPFNPETNIEFSLPTASEIRLEVYNVLGQRVRVLEDGLVPAGVHTVSWNGTDDAGQAVSSGIYLYRLQADTKTLTKKMMLLK